MIYFEGAGAVLHQGDAAEVLRELPEESVQCVVTSPPYDNLRDFDGYTFDFEAIARGLYRVMVPGGVVCWNVADATVNGSETLTSMKQAIYFKEVCGFRMHDTMIYEKVNASRPNKYRYLSCFEYVFVLTKGAPRCFNPIYDKRNVTFGKTCRGKHTIRNRDGSMTERKDRRQAREYGMRSNVWRGLTSGQENFCGALPHPATMPAWLARDLILSWSNPGDTVLDPLCGGGTTAEACAKTLRKFVGIEISANYCELTAKRLGNRLALEVS